VRDIVAGATHRKPRMIEARNGDIPAPVLLGLGVGTEADIENRKSHHELEHEGEGHHAHDHDEFESFVVELGALGEPQAFIDKLKPVIDRHDILRLKGFAEVKGKPMRLVIQAVGSRVDCYFDRPWAADEIRGTRLVVIGLHDEMDDAAITSEIKALG
jgi:cobalamin biosynthesis protein CobW